MKNLSLTTEQFWQFSVDWYHRPQVSAVCIELQDQLQLNVNLILLLCWCDQQSLSLTTQQIADLTTALLKWNTQYTQPLRQIRRHMAKDERSNNDVKRAMLDAEMAVERVEQQLLVETYNQFIIASPVSQQSSNNLINYIELYSKHSSHIYARQIAIISGTLTEP